jgi:broad specificity phosphatase PhoE
MRLYLMRHGQPSTLAENSLLSPVGEQQIRQIAALFSQLGLDLEKVAVLTTPFPRTQQGGELIGQGLGISKDHVIKIPKPLSSNEPFCRAHLLHHIRKPLEENRDTVIFVGHAHYFPLLIPYFTGAAQSEAFPSHGSVISLEGAPGSQGDWQRHWWLAPMPVTMEAADPTPPA